MEFSFRYIFFDLTVSIHIGMIFVFQFYVNHRNTIYKQSNIKSSITNILILTSCKSLILINYFIYTCTTTYMLIVHYQQMQHFIPTLYMHIYFSVFTNKPLSCFIKRSMGNVIFYLGKF